MATYYHHFFARGCELAGCNAPTRECDLYLVEGERRAVRACCGAHAKAAADAEHEDFEAWLATHQPDLGVEDPFAGIDASDEPPCYGDGPDLTDLVREEREREAER